MDKEFKWLVTVTYHYWMSTWCTRYERGSRTYLRKGQRVTKRPDKNFKRFSPVTARLPQNIAPRLFSFPYSSVPSNFCYKTHLRLIIRLTSAIRRSKRNKSAFRRFVFWGSLGLCEKILLGHLWENRKNHSLTFAAKGHFPIVHGINFIRWSKKSHSFPLWIGKCRPVS